MQFAWKAFLERYRPMANALARNLTGCSALADDVVQEAVLSLLRADRQDAARFESMLHARNYFLRTVRNLAAHAGRERKRLVRLEDEPREREGDERALEQVQDRQAFLARLLRELPAEEAEFVARRFLRGETLAKISAATGVAISTLHSREGTLLARLRERMERHGKENLA